jgi:hypothetical protein
MTGKIRKPMHCKGKIPGTNKPCRNELCETDGEKIYLKLESGRECVIRPRRSGAFGFVCERCEYETDWHQKKETNGKS